MALNQKQRKTLVAIFIDRLRANISWDDVESLFVALGAEISEGAGSRVRVYLNGARAIFHRPHPEKEIGQGMVRSIRNFLAAAGCNPMDLLD